MLPCDIALLCLKEEIASQQQKHDIVKEKEHIYILKKKNTQNLKSFRKILKGFDLESDICKYEAFYLYQIFCAFKFHT